MSNEEVSDPTQANTRITLVEQNLARASEKLTVARDRVTHLEKQIVALRDVLERERSQATAALGSPEPAPSSEP